MKAIKSFSGYLVDNLAKHQAHEKLSFYNPEKQIGIFFAHVVEKITHIDLVKFYATKRVINSSKRRPAKLKDLYLASKYFN